MGLSVKGGIEMGKDLKGKELGTGIRQKKNGMYTGRYTDRYGNRPELYARSLSELKRKLNAAIYDDSIGNSVIDNSITLSSWFTSWLEIHKYKVIRNNTCTYYKNLFHKHIETVLGNKKLRDITQLHIKSLLKSMDENGLKFESQRKVKTMLLDMFDKAMTDNYVLKNPAKGIKLIRNEKKDIRVLTKEEQIEFFDCCKGTFYDNLFTVALSTGLRQGELCGLTVNDIDFDKKELTINKTLLYQKLEGDEGKEFHINPPKTKTSNRIIPINRQCEIALKKQFIQRNNILSKKSAKPLEGFDDLLFTTKFGTPICDQIMIDAIKRVVEEINICRDELEQFEIFSPHCLRHTFATRCFEANIPPKTVQLFLGHASLQMTMDLYTHVLENQKQDDMAKLDQLLQAVDESSDDIVESRYDKQSKQSNKIMSINKVG